MEISTCLDMSVGLALEQMRSVAWIKLSVKVLELQPKQI